jgi:uncharacterized damage-inducible protein DinB
MTRSTFIANRLTEVYLNGQWIANTNFKQLIESVTWQQATQKIDSLNTIAQLTFHINYYLNGILNVFNGGTIEIKDKYSFEMQPINSKSDWDQLKQQFLNNAEQFVMKVASFEEHIWDEDFVDKKYGTYQRNIEGVIEHSYYHLGQMSLIKKIILNH